MSFDKPASPEELLHYGVKGMKWGVRKRDENGETSRQRNRRLNKESRAKDRAARDKEIDAARERYNTSARKNYLEAKARYKVEKKTLGTREARKRFNEVKRKNVEDYEIAQQAKSGKEMAFAVLGLVGGVTLLALSSANARR